MQFYCILSFIGLTPKQKDLFLFARHFILLPLLRFYGKQYFNAELIKTSLSLTQKLKYKTAELNSLHLILKFERKTITST